MSYQLPPDIDQRIQTQIALGFYQTTAEGLHEALDALDERNKSASKTIDLAERGIDGAQAADLRQRLKPFAADWDRSEMDAYDAV